METEHKSFISKPLESKNRFIALSDARVSGLAGRITRPAVPRLWPPIPPTRTRPSRRPPRSLTVAPLIADQRGYGEAPVGLE